ncbi:MAG: hypothetical protein ABEI52_08955 [Halobacteriaceae archaeon]
MAAKSALNLRYAFRGNTNPRDGAPFVWEFDRPALTFHGNVTFRERYDVWISSERIDRSDGTLTLNILALQAPGALFTRFKSRESAAVSPFRMA